MPRVPAPAPALTGPQRAMAKLGLVRDIDLALHLPLRYEDETRLARLADAREGDTLQTEATVAECRVDFRPRRQLVAHLADDEGQELVLRFLNFYPSQQKALAPGTRVRVRGELRGGFLGREMVHPTVKPAGAPLPAALTPVYPTTAQLPQAYLRKAIASALVRAPLAEVLPPGTVPAGLPSLRDAVLFLHQPPPGTALAALDDRSHAAWQRLKFDELLAQQLSQAMAQRERAKLHAPTLRPSPGGLHEKLRAAVPFELTAAQCRVVDEIAVDLAAGVPMHRLLQGDVGSGKTIVAALAATIAIDAGWQCALMAPTEILAEQHFRKLVQWLEPLGLTVAWLTGSRKGKGRREQLDAVASGAAGLVIGTHAVIQGDVMFAKLGLAIVDEQHRFGVAQRLALRDKLEQQSVEPHLLMMSATPIPRTLAMVGYADLDVSVIDELPPGRKPIQTVVVSVDRRPELIERIRSACAQGRQAYWVCTLIEESDLLAAQAAQVTAELLITALPELRIGLVHGRLKAKEKDAVMQQFAKAELDVLVATTVIEVGVDVPNASLMLIENAERLGLSQLHQLRGRVGRGFAQSSCVLMYQAPLSQMAKARLAILRNSNDGFVIAERDLELRGAGELLGTKQTGDVRFRIADLQRDIDLLETVAEITPEFAERYPQQAADLVRRWIGSAERYAQA